MVTLLNHAFGVGKSTVARSIRNRVPETALFAPRPNALGELQRAPGEDTPELGRLLPKLNRILPDLPTQMELSPEQAGRQLFNSVGNFIARQSSERPLLLFLEDLHWADDLTLALLSRVSLHHSTRCS